METLKKFMKNDLKKYSMIIALVIIMVFFQIMTGGTLLMPLNVTNMIMQNSYIFSSFFNNHRSHFFLLSLALFSIAL